MRVTNNSCLNTWKTNRTRSDSRRTVRTLDYALNLKLKFSEAYTQRSIGICKKNLGKNNFWMILKGCLKKKYAALFEP